MAPPTRTVSARLPTTLVEEATGLNPEKKISEIITQALTDWVTAMRRQREDDLIKQALSSLSNEQRQDEQNLARVAGKSTLKAMERLDG
ncbi:MAG: hypothetical protein ACYTF1_18525 [Planctomycetota bacterium]|jgi:hypothetical protein